MSKQRLKEKEQRKQAKIIQKEKPQIQTLLQRLSPSLNQNRYQLPQMECAGWLVDWEATALIL